MSFLDRMTTKHTFPGGEKVSLLHRFALKLEVGGRFVEVGFEQAFEPGVERLIHEDSIRVWKTPQGDVPVTAAERAVILARVIEYCKLKELTYRVIGSSGGPAE
jgi:hypothetical protein